MNFSKRSEMPVSAEELFAWHERPGAFDRLNPPFDPVEVIERSGGLQVGAKTVLRMHIGPVPQSWSAVHTAYEPGVMFRDEQQGGPFRKWEHTHRTEALSAQRSALEDSIDYELPMGALGAVFGGGFARHKLESVFAYRHAVTRADLERHAAFASKPRLTIAITGASGSIGSALTPFLTTGGHTVRAVKREGAKLDFSVLEGADAVIHLAGAGVADQNWSEARKKELVESRTLITAELARAIGQMKKPPRVLLSGSAVGIYGDRHDEVLSEASPVGVRSERGAGFLAGLCQDWEAAAQPVTAVGTRLVLLRTGVVLTPRGGALAKLLTPFKAGVGGPTGSGKQWMSWVGMEDMIGAINHALFTDSVSGPVNLVAPNPVTSSDFAKTLGRVLARPAIAPIPAFALKAMFGEMAEGTVLAGQRATPAALHASGFSFLHETLEPLLRFTLGR